MDLDSFQADYRAFKARVMPMLVEWEKAKAEKDAPAKQALDAEVHAPMAAAEDATDAEKAKAAQAAEDQATAEKLAAEATKQAAMSDEEKAKLQEEIHKPLPPPDPEDPTIRKIVKPEPTTIALRPDGPTVAEWVAAGYLAKNYPPSGYASKSTPEEIAAAVKADEVKAAESAAQKQPAPGPAPAPMPPPTANPASMPNQAPNPPTAAV
jgi:hypothetical protein